jgi:hypothetical protein
VANNGQVAADYHRNVKRGMDVGTAGRIAAEQDTANTAREQARARQAAEQARQEQLKEQQRQKQQKQEEFVRQQWEQRRREEERIISMRREVAEFGLTQAQKERAEISRTFQDPTLRGAALALSRRREQLELGRRNDSILQSRGALQGIRGDTWQGWEQLHKNQRPTSLNQPEKEQQITNQLLRQIADALTKDQPPQQTLKL